MADLNMSHRFSRRVGREVVDRRESHIHPEHLAQQCRLVGEGAARGPMHVHFLQRDNVGVLGADRLCSRGACSARALSCRRHR